MNMNHNFGLAFFALTAICLSGCGTPEAVKPTKAAPCVRPDTPILQTSTSLSGEKIVKDEQFELKYDDRGASIDARDPNMDIRDLQAFAITVYRQALQDKLRDGKRLNNGEIELLKFICYVQHLSLSCFTAYGYGHLTNPHVTSIHVVSIEDFKDGSRKSKDDEAKDFFKRSVSNFSSNGNVLAKLIDRWADDARAEDSEAIFQEIVSPEYAKKSNSKSAQITPQEFFMSETPAAGYGVYVYNCYAKDAAVRVRDGNHVADEYVQMFKEIPVDNLNNKQKALLWGRVAESLRFYAQDLGELHKDLGLAITKATDKKTKREVEDLRIKYSSWCEDDFYKFREVYYAYPFVKACHQLNDRVQEARKSFWFNNKDAMESAAMMFCETTSIKNNEMIKNLNCRYAAKVYADTLCELKNRAGERKYNEIQDKCRLWSLDDPEFALGDDVFGNRLVKRYRPGGGIETVKSTDEPTEHQDN